MLSVSHTFLAIGGDTVHLLNILFNDDLFILLFLAKLEKL